jgi:hypothetical protein
MVAASSLRSGTLAPLAVLLALSLPSPSQAAVPLPSGGTVKQVDFERHLMGLFGRMGCNAGSCHGSFQGKGGFRLSLFGYDPENDYRALTRDLQGRRLDRVDPDHSLLLLKATGQIDHGGGRRFSKGSWQYQLVREWIVTGALWRKGSGEVRTVSVSPAELAFPRPGETRRLTVTAQFADGSEENITPLCDFRAHDDAVAEVSNLGEVKALGAGDTAIIVSYRGHVVPVWALVARAAPAGFQYPVVPEANYIDQLVLAKLRRLNIVPSDRSDDAEFLRRVTLDTIGSLPSPDEVRAFLADTDPDKRAKKIDSMLEHPLHAALWATRLCDITGNNTDQLELPQELRPKRSQMWHDWFRTRIAANMPYDEIVRGVLTATSREGLSPEEWVQQARAIDEAAKKGWSTAYSDRRSLDLFWRRQQKVPLEQWGEKTAAAFLGIRLECAQCHKHPFDRWTQSDYRAYANIFSQMRFGASPEAKQAIDAANRELTKDLQGKAKQQQFVREVFVGPAGKGQLVHPDTNKPLPPKVLGGPEIQVGTGEDRRVALFAWMRSPDNPYFARSFVNRVWGHYLGVGLVDPVDNFALGNPPSNPKLLDALAHAFVARGYDIRHLERSILASRTYQLSSRTNETNRLDRNNYAHAYVRPLMAEVVVDVLNTALGVTETWKNDAPAGARAIEIGASRVQNQTVAYCFRIFGRSPRTQACDCERSPEPALPQRLFLMTDPTILAKLRDAKGRLHQLLARNLADDQALEELFLATLSRMPTEEERRLFADYRGQGKDRKAVLTDTLWALINTREFILNH